MKHLASALLLALAAGPLLAQHVHEHGVARLGLVQAGTEVGVEWSGPLDTLVGFEHAPATPEQARALSEATERLRDPATVVSLPGAAGCKLMSVDVAMPFEAHDAEAHQEGEHAHEHEHEGEAEGDPTDVAHGEHADLIVMYDFECRQPEALRSVEVNAFHSFGRLQRVEAAVLTDATEGAARLTRDQSTWTLPKP